MNTNTENLIQAVLNDDDASILVKKIILRYASQSVEHTQELLTEIPQIANKSINILSMKNENKQLALKMLVCLREMNPTDKATYFSAMLTPIMELFPKGNCELSFGAGKQFFAEFLELFKDKNVFDWERDKEWADSNNYTEYLKLVEREMNKNV